ncbi:nitronate monooxygenase [Salibacterium salarium]|uniref:Probable nitronate monooxygenase n=1 Tax=Salibacterium salarium TaxID=284579 RepID=A0A3R9QFS0_9BACI|nr:nitronate monooxygenase [Salibacterium salarium]RSL29449.1 nitronate monooxygenase [Salibacterium salarium]
MNDLVKKLKITCPIIQGGMGNVSHVPLAAAVSDAGGLGTIGAGTLSQEKIKEMIQSLQSETSHPFAVNIPLTVHPESEQVLEIVKAAKVPAVTLSAGNPVEYIPDLKNNGIKVLCVVSNKRQAEKAEQGGADILVAEGYEAAGINAEEEQTTFTLIPQIAAAANIPIVAAGGVGNGSGLLAALSLGAQGVQLGTRLIATKEAQVHSSYKQAICEADSNATTIVGRPFQQIRRLLRTPYAAYLLEQQESNNWSKEEFLNKTDEDHHLIGAIEGKLTEGHVNAGQVSALIDDIPAVSDLFNRMMEEAKTRHHFLSSYL